MHLLLVCSTDIANYIELCWFLGGLCSVCMVCDYFCYIVQERGIERVVCFFIQLL